MSLHWQGSKTQKVKEQRTNNLASAFQVFAVESSFSLTLAQEGSFSTLGESRKFAEVQIPS